MRDGTHFTPCHRAPNCVSSQAPPGDSHHIAPLALTGSPKQALADLCAILDARRDAEIVTVDGDLIHATFSTTLGFVDDVTVLIRPEHSIIDIKSASRLGYYDFGVNRRRVEALRRAFAAYRHER